MGNVLPYRAPETVEGNSTAAQYLMSTLHGRWPRQMDEISAMFPESLAEWEQSIFIRRALKGSLHDILSGKPVEVGEIAIFRVREGIPAPPGFTPIRNSLEYRMWTVGEDRAPRYVVPQEGPLEYMLSIYESFALTRQREPRMSLIQFALEATYAHFPDAALSAIDPESEGILFYVGAELPETGMTPRHTLMHHSRLLQAPHLERLRERLIRLPDVRIEQLRQGIYQ